MNFIQSLKNLAHTITFWAVLSPLLGNCQVSTMSIHALAFVITIKILSDVVPGISETNGPVSGACSEC